MKTLKKGLLLLFAAMFCIAGASAQKKSIAQKADDLFDQYRFYEAAEQYEKAYEKIKDNKAEKNRVYFQLAECYRLMYEYDKARRIYERLANDGYQQFPATAMPSSARLRLYMPANLPMPAPVTRLPRWRTGARTITTGRRASMATTPQR